MTIPQAYRNLCVVVAIFISTVVSPATSLEFSFSKFSSNDARKLVYGDSSTSTILLNAIQVTADTVGKPIENLAGRVLYAKTFALWKRRGKVGSFNTSFVLNIKNRTNPGGEGVAFILTGNSTVPRDSYGKWLGIVSPKLNGSAEAKTVAIEFDTKKSFGQDLDDNHVGLDVNGINSTVQSSLGHLKLSVGVDVLVNIQYNRKNLSVFVGNNQTTPFLVLSARIDLSEHLPKHVYVGFSGSTSNFTELNCVKSWSFYGTDQETKVNWPILIGVPSAVAVLLAAFLVWLVWKVYRNSGEEDDDDRNINVIIGSSTAPIRFNRKELNKATRKFNEANKLGEGGFSTVYKGILDKKEFAVKKISKQNSEGKQEFIAEVTSIGNLNHRNLVKLIGWCHEKNEFMLVYEYMPNGSLDKFIFNPKDQETLSWKKRRNIISGAAQAVCYLHHESEKTVFHRDLKSSNVMLDSDFNAKLGDFGLARSTTENGQTHIDTVVAGTVGYMSPELQMSGRVTVQTDVYAFGVLILETACGRRPITDPTKEPLVSCNIVKWVWDLYARNEIIEAVDKRLVDDYKEEMECMLVLGLACCHPNPHDRPPMNVVVQILKGEAPVPEVEREMPRFVWPSLPPSFNYSEKSATERHMLSFSLEGR